MSKYLIPYIEEMSRGKNRRTPEVSILPLLISYFSPMSEEEIVTPAVTPETETPETPTETPETEPATEETPAV